LFDQPDAERGERAARSIAPGRAVVGDHSVGQAIAPKGADQLLSDRLGPLVGAGRKHDCEARVVVEHGERMQAAGSHRHMAFEVHLPQLVRPRALEANEGGLAAAMSPQFDPMPLQDRCHRRGRRNRFVAEILQPPGDLAPAPRRIVRTNRKHRRLRHCIATQGRAQRSARQLVQSCQAIEPPTLQPFVAGRRTDPETTAQPSHIRTVHRCQHHKLQSLVHSRHLAKRHPTASLIRCRKCPRCLRTPVHLVSSLNSFAGRRCR